MRHEQEQKRGGGTNENIYIKGKEPTGMMRRRTAAGSGTEEKTCRVGRIPCVAGLYDVQSKPPRFRRRAQKVLS